MKKIMILIAVSIVAVGAFAILRATHNGQPSVGIDQDLSSFQSIEGHVVDPSGNPVEGIEVIAAPLLGMLLGSTTDEDGFFAINGVGAGTYEVSTRENDGPTCASCPFYSGGHPGQWFATVRVLKGQVTSNIVLQTPPRFAKLTVLVLDAVTKRPIVGSLITLRRADMPDYFLQTGADTGGYLTEPVPLVPIMIEVIVEGYEPWNCVADYLPPQLTRVGESRKVEAHLRKQAS